MSSLEKIPTQDENFQQSSSLRNVFRAPIVQSSPDPSPSRSRSSSHPTNYFIGFSASSPPLTQLPSSEPQPSTSSLPPPQNRSKWTPIKQTGDNTAINCLQADVTKCKRRSWACNSRTSCCSKQLQNAPAHPPKGA